MTKTLIDKQEEKLELQPEFNRKLATSIKTAGKTGELNFMMEGLTYFPMAVFGEEVRRFYHKLALFRSYCFRFSVLVLFVGSVLGIDTRACISTGV